MNKSDRKSKFKMALISANISMKEFCRMNKIPYNYFSQAINSFITMKEETKILVDSFISEQQLK